MALSDISRLTRFNIMQIGLFSLRFLLPLFLIGCSDPEQAKLNDKPTAVHTELGSKNQGLNIVAKLDNELISMTEIDAKIQLKLFDLEWHKYQLRKAALDATLTTKIELRLSDTDVSAPSDIEILLTPPSAPRVHLPQTDKAIKGSPDAEIKLSLFCSYQSSHCARLQPELRELEARYGQLVNLVFYDLPQTFHRYGQAAANANLCAMESDSQWAYQAALYSNINQLNRERYLIIANQLGLDKSSFTHCIDLNQYQDKLDADRELAQRLGLGNVPVLFVNGLYTKGANTADGYGYYINQELIRLGLPIPSSLPLGLISTSINQPKQDSNAHLKDLNTQAVTEYKHGDTIAKQVTLATIEPERVLLNNNGQMEFLLLKQTQNQRVASTDSMRSPSTENKSNHPHRGADSSAQAERFKQLPTTAKMQLSKHWLSQHLQNKEKLAQHFHATEHQIEGVHLLKLTEIDRSEFYKTLGLQSGDVVLQANNQWVHEGANPLWDALAQEEITLLVMRKGLPMRFDYKTKP
ncbi:hypothetical protein FN961_15545 [Shewanella hanedai]|uniref:Thioredoxin-like fold domain-containing protein n=2 Tax=Shewanella hanedai TaxID=25 RepID=A0A553JLV1_SHEHA|nr:hypothetical protein FN961_15545 [Shewanella hanedai]